MRPAERGAVASQHTGASHRHARFRRALYIAFLLGALSLTKRAEPRVAHEPDRRPARHVVVLADDDLLTVLSRPLDVCVGTCRFAAIDGGKARAAIVVDWPQNAVGGEGATAVIRRRLAADGERDRDGKQIPQILKSMTLIDEQASIHDFRPD